MLEGKTYMENCEEFKTVFAQNKELQWLSPKKLEVESVWELSISSAIGFATTPFLWGAASQTLEAKHGTDFMQRFWNCYAAESAYNQRCKTIEKSLVPKPSLKAARQIKTLAEHVISVEKNDPSDAQLTGARVAKEELLEWLLGCIEKKNPAPLRNLIDSFKEDDCGSESRTLKARLLYCFCELLQKNKAIPTRAELRQAAGIKPQQSDTNNVSKLIKDLGLNTLLE